VPLRARSMADIEVTCQRASNGWLCRVAVTEDSSESTHTVAIRDEDLGRLAAGATDPTDLVRRSFGFLLEREPKEAILRSFDLPIIGRFFPEYEGAIRQPASTED
jgi:hypothetical protein